MNDTELSPLPLSEDSPNELSPGTIAANIILHDQLIRENVENHNDWNKILGRSRKKQSKTLMEKIYAFFSDPSSSIGAFIWTVIVIATVIESTITFIVWTDPQYYSSDNNVVFNGLEIYAVVIFTFDYFIRLFSAPDKKEFLMDFLNLIDFLSILPFYIERILIAVYGDLNISSLAAIRIVRLFRVVRILKISKYTHSAGLLTKTMKNSREAFLMLLFSIILVMILYSSAIFYAEQTESTFNTTTKMWIYNDGVISGFQSISDAMWWCITTLTTVGYGDIVPRTLLGRFIAGLTMLTGVLVLAIPISIFGANFNDIYKEYLIHQRRAAIAVLRAKKTHIFSTSESSSSGSIKNATVIIPSQIEQIRKLKEEQLYLNETLATLHTALKDIEVRNRVINNMVDVILSDSEVAIQKENQKT